MYRYFYGVRVIIPYAAEGVELTRSGNAAFIRFRFPETYGHVGEKSKPRRVVVGKVCEDDPRMMIPNENYYDHISFFREADRLTGDFVSVGARLVIGKIMDGTGLRQVLEGLLGKDAAFFCDLVSFCVTEEENNGPFERYAPSHPLFDEEKRTEDDWMYELEEYMYSFPRGFRKNFFEAWTGAHPGEGARLTFIGHTEDRSGSDGDDDDEDDDDDDDEDYGDDGPEPWEMPGDFFVAFDESGRTPLFYLYAESGTADAEALGKAAAEAERLGYRRVSFYMDDREAAPDVYDRMDARGCGYLVDATGRSRTDGVVRSLMGSFEGKEGCVMKGGKAYGAEAETPFPGEDSAVRRMHAFYIPERREEQERRLDARLRRCEAVLSWHGETGTAVKESDWSRHFDLEFFEAEEFTGADGSRDRHGRLKGYTLKKDAVERDKELFGYFAFVSDAGLTTEEAYRVIDSYDLDENVFARRRAFNPPAGPWDSIDPEWAVDLIEFAALIVRCGIRNAIRDAGLRFEHGGVSEEMPVGYAVGMLEEMGVERDIGTGVYSPVCDIDDERKAILAAFGVTPEEAEEEAERVAGELSFLRARRRRGWKN